MNEQEAKDAAMDKGFDDLVNVIASSNGFIGDIDPRLAYDAGWESAMECGDAENQRYREALKFAVKTLKDDHIQNNKHRMGLIASADIDGVIESLSAALGGE